MASMRGCGAMGLTLTTLWFLVIVVILHQSHIVEAQTCVSITEGHFDHADLCRFLPKSLDSEFIYLSNTSTLATNSTLRSDLQRLIDATRLQTEGLKIAPESCRKAALALSCPGNILQCYMLQVPGLPNATLPIYTPIPVPRPPSYNVCTTMVHHCRKFFKENNVALPDCNAVDAATGLPLFPYSNWTIPLNATLGLYITVPTSEVKESDVPREFQCPAPLIYDHSKDPRCNFPCPSPLYTIEEEEALNLMKGIINVVNFSCAIFIAITYGLNPRLRKWPGMAIACVAICVVIFSIHFLMSFAPVDAVCKSITDNGDRTVPFCLASAFFFDVGGLSTTFWFAIIAVNLFLLLAFDYTLKWQATLVLQVFAFGYPVLAWGIAAAGDGITGYFQGCQINDPWGYAVGLIEIPILICLTTASIIMIPTLYFILKVKARSNQSSSKARKWVSSVRVFLFLLYYVVVLVVYETITLDSYFSKTEIEESVEKWVACNVALEHNCEERYKKTINIGAVFFANVLISICGVIIFLCFGTTEEAIKWWKHLLQGKVELNAKTFSISTTDSKFGDDSAKSDSTKSGSKGSKSNSQNL